MSGKPSDDELDRNLDAFLVEPMDAHIAQPLGEAVTITPRIRTGIEAAVRGLEIADKLRPAVYRLRLAPRLMRAIASGELTMQQAVSGGIRGNVVDSSGKIVGQAAFDVASKGPMLATAAWQLAAQLTAQHFLHEINQRLAGIEKGIGEIKQWLRASWSSDLRGSLAKLHEIASLLVAHDLTDVEVNTHVALVETIDHQCLQIERAVATEMERIIGETRGFRGDVDLMPTTPTLSAKAVKLTAWLTDFGALARQRHLAAYARAVVLQLRTALPVSQAATTARLERLRGDLHGMVEADRRFLNDFLDHIANLKGALTTEKTDDEHRAPLRKLRRSIVLGLAAFAEQTEDLVGAVGGRLSDRDGATAREFCIEVDPATGSVIGLRLIP